MKGKNQVLSKKRKLSNVEHSDDQNANSNNKTMDKA